MNYLYFKLTKPTRLYVKKCSHCGLKYFGKTIRKDIEKYPGSGKYWSAHLTKYKAKSIHIWNSEWYHDSSIIEFALDFSKSNSIVDSNEWANLIEENGIDGGSFERNKNAIEKQKKTMNSSKWKETTGKLGHIKRLNTIKSDIWKETIGTPMYEKISEKTKGINRPWSKKTFENRHKLIKEGIIKNPTEKRWKITDPNGEIFIIDNLSSFCKSCGISQGNLSKYGKTKGYTAECLGFVKDLEVADVSQ
jgi:hypothetical protein